MQLTDYARIVLRRWWIIALMVIVTAGSAFFISSQQTPLYRSTQIILFQPSRADFGLTEASRSLLASAVVYLDSSRIAAQVIEELELPMTPEQLIDNVTFAPDNLSLTVQIDVDTTEPELFGEPIAEAWGEVMVDFRNQQNQLSANEDNVRALLPDDPQSEQIAPNLVINVGAGVILGLLLGLVIVLALEFLESSIIRRRDDLERALTLPVLATIPDFDRA